MIELWLAIGLSSIILTASLFYSYSRYSRVSSNNDENLGEEKTSSAVFLAIPLVFLLSSILFYAFNPSVKLHENWLNTQIETNNILHLKEQNLNSIEKDSAEPKDIQKMLLGLRSLLFKEPENADLWFMLAESYFQLSMVDLADESMKRAIRLKPSANWYVAYAQILALRSSDSDLTRAIGFLNSAIRLEPSHQSAMLTMGFLYLRQQNNAKAVEIWQFLADQIEKNGGDSSRIKKQIELASKQPK